MTPEILAVLLAWAVHLSPYPPPEEPPDIQFHNQGWFEAIPCKGNTPCRVVGWYKDGIIYIHTKYRIPSGFATSVVVHEFVHYLQDLSGKFLETCSHHIAQEREAYAIQNEYLKQATTEIRLANLPSQICTRGAP